MLQHVLLGYVSIFKSATLLCMYMDHLLRFDIGILDINRFV